MGLLRWDLVDISSQDTMLSIVPWGLLNDLQGSGLLPHCLLLKVAAFIVLLRNMHKQSGLMNGTRLAVRNFGSRATETIILTDSHADQLALIPRLAYSSADEGNPFNL